MDRRCFLKSATAAIVFTGVATAGLVPAVLMTPASAQGAATKFPEKPITLIMPIPAGSAIDIWHPRGASSCGLTARSRPSMT
jgi:tripartite-type tricarboxylate transporter receptor subunit TctC